MAVNSRPLYRLSYAGAMIATRDRWRHRGAGRQNSTASASRGGGLSGDGDLALNRDVRPVPPLLPGLGVVANVGQTCHFRQREPSQSGTNSALAIGRAKLGRIDAAAAQDREDVRRRSESPIQRNELGEDPMPCAGDVAASLCHDVPTQELVD